MWSIMIVRERTLDVGDIYPFVGERTVDVGDIYPFVGERTVDVGDIYPIVGERTVDVGEINRLWANAQKINTQSNKKSPTKNSR